MRKLVALSLVLLFGTATAISAGESTDEQEHAIPGHYIEATLGVAYNDGTMGSFTGLEYEYRFNPLFGVGAFADTTFDGFDLAAVGAVTNFHPTDRWKLLAGLGVERKLAGGKDKALFRVGAAYEFGVGNGTISPMIAYDFLEDAKDVVYVGCAIGFAF